MRFDCLVLFLLPISLGLLPVKVSAQTEDFSTQNSRMDRSYEDWADLFNNLDISKNIDNEAIYSYAIELDSLSLNHFIEEVNKYIEPGNFNAMTQFLYFNAQVFTLKFPNQNYRNIEELANKMVLKAHESQDEFLIGKTYRNFGNIMYGWQRFDLVSSYSVAGVRIIEEIYPELLNQEDYLLLGNMLFSARNYEDAIVFSKKGVNGNLGDSSVDYALYNTVGQSFQRLEMLDSAKFYFALCDDLCDRNNFKAWKYVNIQNIAEVQYIEDEVEFARRNFKAVYAHTIEEVPEIAAQARIWLAKISLREGKADSALFYLNSSEKILLGYGVKRLQTKYYLQDSYLTKIQAFRDLGEADSSYFYFIKYSALHDSLEHLASLADLSVVQMRMDHTKNTYDFGQLQIQKELVERRRNVVIFVILLAAAIGLSYLAWQKKRLQYKNKIASLEKEAREAEMLIVKSQLKNFTNQLLEKAKLLEELEEELNSKNESELHFEYLAKLNSSRILTDKDWSEFKLLFERVYPGFFGATKEKYPTITPAEQRIAALLRLQFSAKEMADILGVSVDSVHKSRQRLRQRMELSADTNVEEYLMSF
ncbi:helix-turn-helix transcriptional regulator [Algoriphagus chordae]|uniref:HTH luxR-type domain-containing protein n=1 Tax=Algoriphagus chordae TaxID=237019 RepID=A0A2W7QLG6_9BACT|nr:hypothetical protein [Algoriphagus chordae]PZX46910.1 hypothetical protein LV85_04134 [Algoriphagus chordae]